MSKKIISIIRAINQELNRYVALMLDTKGPEIRNFINSFNQVISRLL
ncbi:MAG: pyruvate kinase [Sweet potato little leaf phytoplasma]|nr:pyruvate kinase [Sweet potato little leaf phytoplasma]